MNQHRFNEGLIDFLGKSPTPYHAACYLKQMLVDAGFLVLDEKESWELVQGGKYIVVRNDASLIAFCMGEQSLYKSGLRMIGAHTDSPSLKIKPRPDIVNKSFVQLGVEVYGGPILHTWFDRELSIGGRVSWIDNGVDGVSCIRNALVDFVDPVAIIPNIAIHLDRDSASSKSVNKQTDLPPVMMLDPGAPVKFRELLFERLIDSGEGIPENAIFDYDLMLYDPNGPVLTGLKREFITCGRLDNLISCYCVSKAMIEGSGRLPSLIVLNDHEEVGSVSTSGAGGNFLLSVLQRICGNFEDYSRAAALSFMISADNAHGVHPNYPDRYEPNHLPLLNNGPVIKYNSNQRYATDSRSGAAFRFLCAEAGIGFQEFVVRSDMACGSTIGPMTSSCTGIRTVDAGVPMFAMHSIRETAGLSDAEQFYKVLLVHLKTLIV